MTGLLPDFSKRQRRRTQVSSNLKFDNDGWMEAVINLSYWGVSLLVKNVFITYCLISERLHYSIESHYNSIGDVLSRVRFFFKIKQIVRVQTIYLAAVTLALLAIWRDFAFHFALFHSRSLLSHFPADVAVLRVNQAAFQHPDFFFFFPALNRTAGAPHSSLSETSLESIVFLSVNVSLRAPAGIQSQTPTGYSHFFFGGDALILSRRLAGSACLHSSAL